MLATRLLLLADDVNGAGTPQKDDVAAESGGDVLAEAYDMVVAHGMDFLLNLVAALAIFVIGRWITGFLVRIVRAVTRRAKLDEMLVNFAGNLCYGFLMAFVILAALERLGVDTTSFAAVIAAAGLAVGLALQGSLSNFAAGVMLVVFRPFKVGDFVEAGGTKGIVEEINIFHTRMRTPDNIAIIVPNGEITDGVISNYSDKPTRRVDLVVGCGYDDDLRAVKRFLVELVTQDERILADPAPEVRVSELADSSVNLVVRPWVNASDFWPVKCDLVERIKIGFDDRGFSIPFPQTDVHVHQVSA